MTGWQIQRRRRSHLNAVLQDRTGRYFLKWFFHRGRRNPAQLEWRNANQLEALGIPTVEAVGWGRHDSGSFVVLRGADGLQADERWRHGIGATTALAWTDALAVYVARLHEAGLCHRDLNIYHVLLDGASELRLIDVGRVMGIGWWRPRRWLIKDLASLHYSAQREGFPPRLARRFLRRYVEATSRPWTTRRLLARVLAKSARYRRHNEHKEGRGEPL